MKRLCNKCNLEKDLAEFTKCKGCKYGYSYMCKKCRYIEKAKQPSNSSETRKLEYLRLKKDKKRYENYLTVKKAYRSANRQRYLFLSCRKRAQIENIPFNIEINDIIIPEICPILETKIIHEEGSDNLYSPSVDKIIPELGYIKGNIRVISRKANMMKLNANKEELVKFSKNIVKYINENN